MVSGAAIEYSVAVRETRFGVAFAGFGLGVLSSLEQADTATNAMQRDPKARYLTGNLHHSLGLLNAFSESCKHARTIAAQPPH
jgi:hypothetical protein